MNRRGFLRRAGVVAGTASVAGCASDDDQTQEPPRTTARPTTDRTPTTDTTTPPADGTLPGDAMVFDSDRSGTFEVYAMTLQGAPNVRALTGDDRWDSWWPRISPDRTRILFYRTPAGVHDTDYSKTSLWLMAADGSNHREIVPQGAFGWDRHGHAEWSPDGSRLLMFGGPKHNPQVFVTAPDGSNPQQITDRGGVNLDPSWAPDGEGIAFVGCPESVCFPGDYEIWTHRDGDANRVTDDGLRDHDPYYSPDGTLIAWLTERGELNWDIRLASVDGSGTRYVTNDEHINSKPEWTPDGSRLFFHRFEHGGDSWSIYSIHPDGSGLTEVTADQPGNNEYPSL